jgi:hypothetical protein
MKIVNKFPVLFRSRPRCSIFFRVQRFYYLLVAQFNQSFCSDYFHAVKRVVSSLFNLRNFLYFLAICFGSIFYDFRSFLVNFFILSGVVSFAYLVFFFLREAVRFS